MAEEKIDPGMTGYEIFETLGQSLTEDAEKADLHIKFAYIQMLFLHARALSAHCECLGMNAENMWAAIANANPVYRSEHYYQMMSKWGLSDEKRNPII